MKNLHLYDFGVFIELHPDEEEKMMLENNIQMAIQQQGIELEDAVDVREIRSVKLANQVLKVRRKKKIERDQMLQQQNMQAQADTNIQTQQAAAEMEMQKQQGVAQSKMSIDTNKAQLDSKQLMLEADLKKQLMAEEFQYNMQLKGLEVDGLKEREGTREDRKDQRTKIQATQQSEMIDQRKKEKPPKNFESSGNDIISGDFDLGAFEPR